MNISPETVLTWRLACIEAIAAQSEFIEPEHFLEALTKLAFIYRHQPELLRAHGVNPDKSNQSIELVVAILRDARIDPDDFRHQLRAKLGVGDYEPPKGAMLHRSDRSRLIFDVAVRTAIEMGSKEVGIEHLLLALLAEKESPGLQLLKEKGADSESLAAETRRRVASMVLSTTDRSGSESKQDSATGTPFLDRYGRDLTKEAAEGRLGPIVGRQTEILQVIQTLARRTKNNPVLVGEPGVGKTAVVQALAIRTATGEDPQVLGGKRIIELNLTALVGGTRYRGDFEERLASLIEECKNHREIILFIDELHTLIGAGRAEGSIDAANILKPALARGDICCIGATTVAEYRRYIESDPALERRFEKILVSEPGKEETLEIITGLRHKWEEHHGVSFTDAALEAAVNLSVRFDCDHLLPDKAIDLLDKAGARARVPMLSMQATPARGKKTVGGSAQADCTSVLVTEQTVAEVLSERSGVPLDVVAGHLEGMNRSRLLDLEAFLTKRVIGQDQAIERVCQRLLMAHAGLTQRRGPLAVFLFLGPSGVGKTELARSITHFLFGSEDAMIRLDMSEFGEEHSVAKLTGSPPGYVGHEEEGQLTGKLRSRPYSVVLLDEIEKAHPHVFDLFLQVFDEGRLTDAKGRTADARNAIFIMTSNIQSDRGMGYGFGEDNTDSQSSLYQEVRNRFRPEFVNRIDDQIAFRTLSIDDVEEILIPMVQEIRKTFHDRHGKALHISDEAVRWIAESGYSSEYGVRYLRRAMQDAVEVPLSRLVLSGELQKWLGVAIEVDRDEISLKPFLSETI